MHSRASESPNEAHPLGWVHTSSRGQGAWSISSRAGLRRRSTFSITSPSCRSETGRSFPLTFDASLAGVDLAGDYDVDITAVYCDGFANCSLLPQFDELTIVETSQGWLRVEIDGYYDAGQIAMISKKRALGGGATSYAAFNTPDAVLSVQSGTTGEGAAR